MDVFPSSVATLLVFQILSLLSCEIADKPLHTGSAHIWVRGLQWNVFKCLRRKSEKHVTANKVDHRHVLMTCINSAAVKTLSPSRVKNQDLYLSNNWAFWKIKIKIKILHFSSEPLLIVISLGCLMFNTWTSDCDFVATSFKANHDLILKLLKPPVHKYWELTFRWSRRRVVSSTCDFNHFNQIT